MVLFPTIISIRQRGHARALSSPPVCADDDSAAATAITNSTENKYHKTNVLNCKQSTSCKSILMIGAVLLLMTFPLVHQNFRPLFYLRRQSQNDSSGMQAQLTNEEEEASDVFATEKDNSTPQEEK